jgi:ferredoxin
LVKVRFLTSRGEAVEAEAAPGALLLSVAQSAGMPLEGTCEGQMACSTCHVIIEPNWFSHLPKAHPDEEDMLDLATGVMRTSRLSCQIVLTDALDGLEVRIPEESRDMRGR